MSEEYFLIKKHLEKSRQTGRNSSSDPATSCSIAFVLIVIAFILIPFIVLCSVANYML